LNAEKQEVQKLEKRSRLRKAECRETAKIYGEKDGQGELQITESCETAGVLKMVNSRRRGVTAEYEEE
jgi:hypothetical protein